MSERFTKDSQAVLDYKWDWSDWLENGETIISEEITSTPTGLTIDSHSSDGTTVTAWLSDGVDNSVYLVTCSITTSQARTDERSIIISCAFR